MKVTPGITLFALAIACGGERTPPADTTPPAEPVSQTPNAAATIIAPAEGDTTGSDVTIVLGKEGVTIEKASGVRADGIGHHHLFLDTAAVADGQVIPPTSRRVVHIGTGDSTYTFKGLSPGAHEVVAVIGHGDHSAMVARRDTVRFVVKR
jgi:hypothetical protein